MRETLELPLQNREARFQPSTVDDDTRTIELTWTTGATVRRRRFFSDDFDEQLILDDGAVRMARLNGGGANLLDSHYSYELSAVLGVVERAWFEGEGKKREGRALVRFSDRADVEPIWRDVKAGIIRNVSVGYAIHATEVIERKDNKIPLMRVTDWEPMELSMVAIPADAGAHVRSQQERRFPCVIERTGTMATQPTPEAAPGAATSRATEREDATNVTDTNDRAAPEKDKPETKLAVNGATTVARAETEPSAQRVPSEAEIRQRIEAELAGERERAIQIRQAAKVLKIAPDIAERMIAEGISLETARTKLFDAAAERDQATQIVRGAPQISAGEQDEETVARDAMVTALLHRRWPAQYKLTDAARQYVGLNLIDLARDRCEAAGIKTRGLSKMEIAGIALTPGFGVRSSGFATRGSALHTTSDYVSILMDAQNKSLRNAYDLAPRTFLPFCSRATAPDFKNVNRLALGEAPVLMRVNEHGEFTRGTIGEMKEVYALVTYGRVFAITRQAIVNDDLDAFTRVPQRFGAMAAQKEGDVVWAVLLANAAMGDGTALFHANHGNLIASGSGAPSVTTVAAAKALMSKQTGIDGVTLINATGRFLLVPPALELAAWQMVSSIVPAQSSNVVPDYIRSLTPISEPRLEVGVNLDGTTHGGSAVEWYLAADPAMFDTIEYMYLEGEEGVMLDTRVGFDIDGVETKARLDFAAKAIDWRGLVRSDGVA